MDTKKETEEREQRLSILESKLVDKVVEFDKLDKGCNQDGRENVSEHLSYIMILEESIKVIKGIGPQSHRSIAKLRCEVDKLDRRLERLAKKYNITPDKVWEVLDGEKSPK